MYYNETNEIIKNPTALTALTAMIASVGAVPLILIGGSCVALTLFINKGKKKNKRLEQEIEILEERLEEAPNTAYLAVNPTVDATVAEPLNEALQTASPSAISTVEDVDDETLKKEMIRMAMSELGKRSAKVRAEKKSILSQL